MSEKDTTVKRSHMSRPHGHARIGAGIARRRPRTQPSRERHLRAIGKALQDLIEEPRQPTALLALDVHEYAACTRGDLFLIGQPGSTDGECGTYQLERKVSGLRGKGITTGPLFERVAVFSWWIQPKEQTHD